MMRRNTLLLLFALLACLGSGCAPKPEFRPTSTIREIMQSMVEPGAETLWNSVSSSVSEKGVETNAPKNDEEWAKVRHDAVAVLEATNLILMEGRHVARSGEKAQDPKAQLEPEQIEALINQDKASWTKYSHDLHDAVMVAVHAIDAKDADGLMNAGDGLNTACENCHLKYWYPNERKEPKK